MRRACPYCAGTGYAAKSNSDEALSWLRRECREKGIAVTFDDAVSAKDAAKLMLAFSGNGSESFLANDRAGAGAIPYVKRANGRVVYPLPAFADYLTARA